MKELAPLLTAALLASQTCAQVPVGAYSLYRSESSQRYDICFWNRSRKILRLKEAGDSGISCRCCPTRTGCYRETATVACNSQFCLLWVFDWGCHGDVESWRPRRDRNTAALWSQQAQFVFHLNSRSGYLHIFSFHRRNTGEKRSILSVSSKALHISPRLFLASGKTGSWWTKLGRKGWFASIYVRVSGPSKY